MMLQPSRRMHSVCAALRRRPSAAVANHGRLHRQQHHLLHSTAAAAAEANFAVARADCSGSLGSSTAPPVRIGFIGAGDISNLHAEGLRACGAGSAELVGIWSRADAVVPSPAAKASEYGCALYDSAEDLCADETIDAIFVLTNFETHEKYATMAMEAGKHVLVEKPVGATVAELQRMQSVARRRGVVCVPGHNYIHEAPLVRARGMVESGELGRLTSVYVMYNIEHPEQVCARFPGVIRQIMTHHAYVAIYLLGSDPANAPAQLSCFRSTIRDEDGGTAPQENHAQVSLRTEGGTLIHLCASFAADDHSSDPWSFYVKLIGTKGSVRYSYNDWVVNAQADNGVHSHSYVPYPHTVRDLDRHFVEQVLGAAAAAPLSTMDDAILCQRICEAAERSAEEGEPGGVPTLESGPYDMD